MSYSLWKPKDRPYYQCEIRVGDGRRYRRSTGKKSRRDADAWAREEERRLANRAAVEQTAGESMAVVHVAARYWEHKGKHAATAHDIERDLARIVAFFGADRLITEIRDSDVASLVAWRRGHRRPNTDRLVTNATVNRTTTELLRRLMKRSKCADRITWSDHILDEPEERVRELRDGEGEALEAATREDYAPFFAYLATSGRRLSECLIRWTDVNWRTRQIIIEGKGGRRTVTPITPTIEAIVRPLIDHHPEWVFTYVCRRTRTDPRTRRHYERGRRYPITFWGAVAEWKRLRRRAGVVDFRAHDFRHDVGSKLLRATGNLKLVQKALGHSSLTTTARYAHVLDEEVAAALEARAQSRRKSTQNPTRDEQEAA